MKKLLSLLLALTLLVTVCACGGNQNNAAGNIAEPPVSSETPAGNTAEPPVSSETPAGDTDASGEVDTVLTHFTGLDPDETVATVGDVEIPAQLYFYWLNYSFSNIEYQVLVYANYGMYPELLNEDGSVNWNASLDGGDPLVDIIRAQAESAVIFSSAVDALAAEHGITLDGDALAAVQAEQDDLRAQLGSEENFQAYLKVMGVTAEGLEHIGSTSGLYNALLNAVLTEGSPLYLDPASYDDMATYADHILLATIDLATGEALPEDQIAAKRATAEDLLAQLRASDDPLTLFSQLADAYSEDTGRISNPNGYIYTPGTMVASFENAASALEPGQFSDIVESEYGFHIILRRDLQEGLAADEKQLQTMADTHLGELLLEKTQTMPLVTNEKLDAVNVIEYYAASSIALESFQSAFEANQGGGQAAG